MLARTDVKKAVSVKSGWEGEHPLPGLVQLYLGGPGKPHTQGMGLHFCPCYSQQSQFSHLELRFEVTPSGLLSCHSSTNLQVSGGLGQAHIFSIQKQFEVSQSFIFC